MGDDPVARIARLEARMDAMEAKIGDMADDVRVIRDTLVEAKGGLTAYKAVAAFFGLTSIGGVIAVMSWLASMVRSH